MTNLKSVSILINYPSSTSYSFIDTFHLNIPVYQYYIFRLSFANFVQTAFGIHCTQQKRIRSQCLQAFQFSLLLIKMHWIWINFHHCYYHTIFMCLMLCRAKQNRWLVGILFLCSVCKLLLRLLFAGRTDFNFLQLFILFSRRMACRGRESNFSRTSLLKF